MPLRQLVAPAEEPISLQEAKLHLRVDTDADDGLITTLIGAARQTAEMLTGRQLVTARWLWTMDSFPRANLAICLPKSPLQNVISMTYLDLTGAIQSVDLAAYVVDAVSEPARITPVWSKAWPLCLPQMGAVSIVFDAGYGSAASVPDGIKSWIKLRVGSLYGCREELSTARIDAAASGFFNGLLDPFRVMS